MESVRGSYSKLFSSKDRDKNGSFLCLRDALGRAEIRLLRPPFKPANVNFSLSISLPPKRIRPIFSVSSLSSSDTTQDEDPQNEETWIKDINQAKTVHVKFQLQRECSFGQQFLVVGDHPMFGLWDPENAVPLNWSDGHVWTVELEVPIGKSIKFKFIMKEGTESILWQPGPDRMLETWETEKTITICEDWDNAEFQMIIEEEPTSNQIEDSTTSPETLLVAENVAETIATRESTINGFPGVMEMPFAEKPTAIIAENIIEAKENPQDLSSTNDVGNSEYYEGAPVLVPGLTLLTAHSDDGSTNEAEKDIFLTVSTGAETANDLNLPELHLKEEHDIDSPHLKEGTEMMFKDKQELYQNEHVEAQQLTEEPDQSITNPFNNDIQWGQKILQKLLNNLGIV